MNNTLELVENQLDIESQDTSGQDAGDELDQDESPEISDGDAGEGEGSEPEEAPARLADNPAAALCIRAWHITYNNERAKLAEGANDYDAKQEANDAFLAAMPPLSGHKNIVDFIACVSQAYLWEIMGEKRATRLFAAAKLALIALRSKPKPGARRGPGRPRKTARKAE
jgi:hypothetical protein